MFLGAHCPENVSAILRDEYKEVDELIPGYWDYHWTYKRKPGSCFCWQKPTLVLILDFQSSAEEQTLNRMSRLLDAQSMADIKFIVRGENINAHLAVMASASPVIKAMFQGNRFKEGTTKTVQITDISPEAFKHLLQFVYSGKIPLLADSTETMEMLFFAADKYEIQELKDICKKEPCSSSLQKECYTLAYCGSSSLGFKAASSRSSVYSQESPFHLGNY